MLRSFPRAFPDAQRDSAYLKAEGPGAGEWPQGRKGATMKDVRITLLVDYRLVILIIVLVLLLKK